MLVTETAECSEAYRLEFRPSSFDMVIGDEKDLHIHLKCVSTAFQRLVDVCFAFFLQSTHQIYTDTVCCHNGTVHCHIDIADCYSDTLTSETLFRFEYFVSAGERERDQPRPHVIQSLRDVTIGENESAASVKIKAVGAGKVYVGVSALNNSKLFIG